MALHGIVLSLKVVAGAPSLHNKTIHFGSVIDDVTARVKPTYPSPDVRLVGFKAEEGRIYAEYPSPDVLIRGALPVLAQFYVEYPSPKVLIAGTYSIGVNRGLLASWGAPHQVASPLRPTDQDVPFQKGTTLRGDTSIRHTWATPTKRDKDEPWEEGTRTRARTTESWQVATPAHPEDVDAPYQVGTPTNVITTEPWQVATGVILQSIAGPHQDMGRIRPIKSAIPWGAGTALIKRRVYSWGKGKRFFPQWKIPWGEGRVPYPGTTAPPPVIPPETPPTFHRPFHGNILHFICPWLDYGMHDVPIHFREFACEADGSFTRVVPTLRCYMILNSVSMKRVDDNTAITITSVNLGADYGSWCWTFSGTIPYTEFDKIAPDVDGPVEVEITINSLVWRFWIEGYDRKRTFGATDITIKGRSVTAELDRPYSDVRSYTSDNPMYAKALAQAELDRVPSMPYTLDFPDISSLYPMRQWDADDGLGNGWLIPSGGFSYNSLTPMEALNYLVSSVGGYVQSHPSEKKIIVASSYPHMPWKWSTVAADYVLPKSILKSDSLQWQVKPQYNRVFVSGRTSGVNALVRSTNYADLQAQQYVHELITDVYAAREKGKSILSNGGKMASVTIDVPLDPTPPISMGIITPGMMVRIDDSVLMEPSWRGVVRGISLTASASYNEMTINQSITIERHY